MIFITGTNSFIGNKLVENLVKKKIKYFGVDIKESKNKINFKKKDINDNDIYKYIPKNSTVIHLAAISNVKDCEAMPMETLRTNINGTINLLHQSIKKKIKHFIFASTEWVYPDQKKIFNENTHINFNLLDNNYAISKFIGEKIVKNYSKNFKVTILRFGIIYADRTKAGSAIETLVNLIKKSNVVEVGSVKTSRRFIHIDDIVEGIILAYKRKVTGIFNLTGDKDINLKKIIYATQKYLNKKVKIIQKESTKKSIKKVSNLKAKKIMVWSPKINLSNGIEKLF